MGVSSNICDPYYINYNSQAYKIIVLKFCKKFENSNLKNYQGKICRNITTQKSAKTTKIVIIDNLSLKIQIENQSKFEIGCKQV